MSDLMGRLRAANPVTEEPALPSVEPLLARLDERPRRRPRRRWVLVPAVAVALALIVVLATGRGPNVVAEAQAALGGPGGIVHVIVREERFNPDRTLVEGSGKTSEIWSASD